MGRRTWIKIFTDKWLRGTLRDETVEIRGIWVDILTLAGDSAYGDEGYIKLADKVGYTDEQIAAVLQLKDLKIWVEAKKTLKETDRIEILGKNIIRIVNWKKYQSEYNRQKKYRVTKDSYSPKLLPKVIKTHSPSPSQRGIYKGGSRGGDPKKIRDILK